MPPGRHRPILLVALVLFLGIGAFVFLRFSASVPVAAEIDVASPPDDSTATKPREEMPIEAAEEVPSEPDLATQEDATPSRTLAASERLELLVLDAGGAPVPSAGVVLWRGEELLHRGTTDAEGLVAFQSGGGSASFLVRVEAWNALQGELELAAGRRALTLPESALVAGNVLLDGAVPAQPLELVWQTTKPRDAMPDVPPAILKALAVEAAGKFASSKTTTDVNGAFAFRRVAPGVQGWIAWTGPYVIEGSNGPYRGQRLTVPEPKSDILLRLQSALQVRLRVVDGEQKPVPNASIMMRREQKNSGGGSRSSSSSFSADANGVATALLGTERYDTVEFEVGAKDGSGQKKYAYPWPTETKGIWDLGDLALQPTREIGVLVQDDSGAPIQGARAYAWPTTMRRDQAKTGPDGRLSMFLGAEQTEVAVEAFGYLSNTFAAPAGSTELVCVLRRACLLQFEVAGADAGKTALSLELRSPSAMFEGRAPGDREGPDTVRSLGSGWSSSTDDKGETFEFEPEKNGLWRVNGIAPGVAIHARLSSAGVTLSELDVPPLRPGEQRTFTFSLAGSGRAPRIRVLSPSGEPVARADVWMLDEGEGRSYQSFSTDGEGAVTLPAVFGDRCRLRVAAASYGTKLVQLSPIPDAVVDVRMEPGRSVEVQLVDAAGAAFTAPAQVRIDWPYAGSMTQALGGGRYRIDGLPLAVVSLKVYPEGGRWISALHNTSNPVARITLGGSGQIGCVVSLKEGAARSGWAVALAPAGSATDSAREPIDTMREQAWANFESLQPGSYEVWLERRDELAPDERWIRTGAPKAVTIDAEHVGHHVDLVIE